MDFQIAILSVLVFFLALAVVLVIATVWWFATARRRFQGPVSYGSPDEVAAMDLI